MTRLKLKLLTYLFLLSQVLHGSNSANLENYVLRVDKSDGLLKIETKSGKLIKKYSIASGRGGKATPLPARCNSSRRAR